MIRDPEHGKKNTIGHGMASGKIAHLLAMEML